MMTQVKSEPLGHGMIMPVGYTTDHGKTFDVENSLPSLPIPPLGQTLRKYLDSAQPHLTADEYSHTESLVKAFETGVGVDLHRRLNEKAKYKRNWLETWWEDYGYLYNREPHTPFVSFAGPGPYIEEVWRPQPGTQLQRGALCTWFVTKYWELLRQQKLPVDRGGKKTLWSMYQYYRMFNGCKRPGVVKDTLQNFFRTDDEGACATHWIIICKGRFFKMDVCDTKGQLLTAPEIEAHFRYIREFCDSQDTPGLGLGALTAAHREEWAKLRQRLVSIHDDNERYLTDIETSIGILVLDETSPENIRDLTLEGLGGEPLNRWFDKPIQFIFCKNGTITSNGDHAPYDAIIPVYMMYFVYQCIHLNGHQWKGEKAVRALPQPKELVFHVDDVIQLGIQRAAVLYRQNSARLELHIGRFTDFGKPKIRSYKLHPDFFMQLAMQLTYYRMYNKPAPTYETASTRQFYHARTGTVRSCTPEALQWSKAMRDLSVPDQERYRLLRRAVDKHSRLMVEAMNGQDCDRHLLGLQITALEDGIPLPDIYKDVAYTKSGGGGNFIMSSSMIGFTPCFGGVAPMCKDGYGIFYSIMDSRINIYVISWVEDKETNSKQFCDCLAQSLRDMMSLLDSSVAKL